MANSKSRSKLSHGFAVDAQKVAAIHTIAGAVRSLKTGANTFAIESIADSLERWRPLSDVEIANRVVNILGEPVVRDELKELCEELACSAARGWIKALRESKEGE